MIWLIYFCCYVSSIGTDNKEANISGRIIIYPDSVVTYLYPVDYLSWKIDSVINHTERYDTEPPTKTGIYFLSNKIGKSVLNINNKYILQYVIFKEINYYEVIQFKKTLIAYGEIK